MVFVVLILINLVVRLAVALLVILASLFSFVVLNLLLFTALISKLLGFIFLTFRFEMNSVSINLSFVTFFNTLALILPLVIFPLLCFATIAVLLNITPNFKLVFILNFISLGLNLDWFESFELEIFLPGITFITLDFILEAFFFRGAT